MTGRGVFIDRDGVINKRRLTLVRKPEHLTILPGVPETIARLDETGYSIVIVTNQSPVGYGFIQPEHLAAIHARIREAVAEAGGHVDAIYASTHRKGEPGSDAKPRPDMLERGADRFELAPEECWMIGDKPSDIQAGSAFGARTIWITGQRFPWDHLRKTPPADFQAHGLPEAAEIIQREDGRVQG